jgi:hypothetical protein
MLTATVASQMNPALTDTDSFQIEAAPVADLSAQQGVNEDPAAVNRLLIYTLR